MMRRSFDLGRVLPAALLLLALAGSYALAAFPWEGKTPGPVGALPRAPLTVVTEAGRFDFVVEVADEEAERRRGLMFRPELGEAEGMLFFWPGERPRVRRFWMKNTPSSLDIIYIDEAGKIVSIAPRTEPGSEDFIPSEGPAHAVLELRAGRAGEIGAGPGDLVVHPYFGE
ncbi:DUF192 domain-containing protein [Tepidicaulis sp. LMO-SS28]|uniref:DUF192 domain-containing protein n=1 Tax=Tepidicaulis sp. LMO-SS28 TaxID=3447455 RepID=UPI003EDE7A64